MHYKRICPPKITFYDKTAHQMFTATDLTPIANLLGKPVTTVRGWFQKGIKEKETDTYLICKVKEHFSSTRKGNYHDKLLGKKKTENINN